MNKDTGDLKTINDTASVEELQKTLAPEFQLKYLGTLDIPELIDSDEINVWQKNMSKIMITKFLNTKKFRDGENLD